MKNKLICLLIIAASMLISVGYCSEYVPTAQTLNSSGVVIVKGMTDSSYSGKDITLMLLDKNASSDDVNVSDIGYVTQGFIGYDGSYLFKFKCTNAAEYNLIAYINGDNVTESITEAKLLSDRYMTSVDVDMTKYNLKATVNIDNVFSINEGVEFYPVFAFYNGNTLISAKKGIKTAIEETSMSAEFECDVPDGTTSSKAYVWNDIYIPLCKAKNISNEFYEKYIHSREIQTSDNYDIAPLENTFKKLAQDEQLNVAFMGGSVTSGVGSTNEGLYSWRAKTMNWLNENYPEADIKYCNAAIGGTGSKLGAYRIYHDILDKMTPDLIFIMHSINDYSIEENTDTGKALIKQQLETEINNVMEQNPNADIVILYDIDRTTARQLYNEDIADSSSEHEFYWTSAVDEEIAKHYNITSINIGKALTSMIGDDINNDETWSKYFNIEGGGMSVHPTNLGYEEYFKVIREFLEEQKYLSKDKLNEEARVKVLPQPLTNLLSKPTCYGGDDLETGLYDCEWEKVITVPNYHDFETSEYTKYDLLYPIKYVATAPEQSFTYTFTGKEFAIRMYGGSNVEYSVDNGEYIRGSFAFPIVCAQNLTQGEHTVTIRTTSNYDISAGEVSFDSIMIR